MIKRNPEQEAQEAEELRQHYIEQQKAKRAHELEMARLKLQIKPRNDTYRTIVKGPTYPLAVLCITILTLAGKPVPAVLADFLAK